MDRFVTGYVVDTEGFIIEIITVDLLDATKEIPSNVIVIPPPIDVMLNKRKWNGLEWIEGESLAEKEERESQQLLESMKPSQEELADADLEIKMITLLMEMEVV